MKIPRCVIRDEKLFQFHITDRVNIPFARFYFFSLFKFYIKFETLSLWNETKRKRDSRSRNPFSNPDKLQNGAIKLGWKIGNRWATSNGHRQICAWARIQIIRFTRWPCIFIVIKPCQVVAPISLCNYPAPPIILFYLFFSFFFFSKTDNSISIRINRGINDESLIQSTLVRKSKRNR